LDVIEIDGASNNSVDDIRALRENIRYVPTQQKYKVYIIDEVHMLSDSAFNALLKTLEEPPAHAIFIFATTEPHKLPQTVLSRCQRFDFRRIPTTDLVNTVEAIGKKENLKIEREAAYVLARRADGSLRDVLSLLDQVIAYGGESESDKGGMRAITPALVGETLGLVDQEKLFELTDCIAQKDTSKGISLLNQLVDSGIDVPEFVNSLLHHLRNLLVVKVGGDSSMLFDLSDNYLEKYKEKSSHFSDSDILRMLKAVADLNAGLKRTSDPRILLEMTLMKLLKMETSVNLAEVLDKLNLLDQRQSGCVSPGGQSGPEASRTQSPGSRATGARSKVEVNKGESSSPVAETSSTRRSGDQSLTDVQRRWDEVLGRIKKAKLSLWSLLKEGEIMALEDDTLTVEFFNGKKFHKRQAERRENFNLIQKTLGEVFDQSFGLRFELNEDKMPSPTKPQDSKSKGRRSQAADDPLVKSIMDTFEGEII
jgi:DNA polymerase-3 subunit gamma/tau